ncbi:metallophosphoesterase [Halieaceae bacterium]|nr:metallophosphoesterase [Halieaceae bacterium]
MYWLAGLLLTLFSQVLAAESIVFIADLNGRYGSAAYAPRVDKAIQVITGLRPELVISAGDMVAGQKQPQLDSDRLDAMWRAFNDTVADPLLEAGIPLAVTVGNHDGSAFPGFALERERFQAQWQSRVPELDILPGSEWPRRYAARMGTVLLLAFDGTRPGKLPGAELRFIERMLQQYGTEASAILAFSHLPMWPLTRGREQEILDDPDLLALLHGYGVDVYASGHHHAFFAGADEAGMVHIGVGALGGNARAFSTTGVRQPFSFAVLTVEGGQVSVAARSAPDFSETVPLALLPEFLAGPLGTLQRLDGPVRLRSRGLPDDER